MKGLQGEGEGNLTFGCWFLSSNFCSSALQSNGRSLSATASSSSVLVNSCSSVSASCKLLLLEGSAHLSHSVASSFPLARTLTLQGLVRLVQAQSLQEVGCTQCWTVDVKIRGRKPNLALRWLVGLLCVLPLYLSAAGRGK